VLRNVPDVSANANYNMFICFKNKCNGGWGGTSFSAPMWAGFVALINEQGAANGKQPVGLLNPTLYGMLKTDKGVLHDPIGNHSGLYTAVRGYDLVTGLGSPTGARLIRTLAGN
jgi:kumamolisin